jgi:hypothetical protein
MLNHREEKEMDDERVYVSYDEVVKRLPEDDQILAEDEDRPATYEELTEFVDDLRGQMNALRTSVAAIIAKQDALVARLQNDLMQKGKELAQARRERDLFTEASAVNLQALMQCSERKAAVMAERAALHPIVVAALKWQQAHTLGEAGTAAGHLFAALDTLPAHVRDSVEREG